MTCCTDGYSRPELWQPGGKERPEVKSIEGITYVDVFEKSAHSLRINKFCLNCCPNGFALRILQMTGLFTRPGCSDDRVVRMAGPTGMFARLGWPGCSDDRVVRMTGLLRWPGPFGLLHFRNATQGFLVVLLFLPFRCFVLSAVFDDSVMRSLC